MKVAPLCFSSPSLKIYEFDTEENQSSTHQITSALVLQHFIFFCVARLSSYAAALLPLCNFKLDFFNISLNARPLQVCFFPFSLSL